VPADQRAGCGGGGGAAAGVGNGDPAAGAAAAFGGFGFFGRIGLRAARGGGPAGRSSATTGLGSTVMVSGLVKSPGVRITRTGMVTGWNLGIAKVTVKPASGAATAIEQGVLQPGPAEVVASAPDGTDSSCICTGGGADFHESRENEEHPARLAPATAIAMTRRMINHSTVANRHNPQSPTIRAREQGCNAPARIR